ncbi:hypothetical protein [Nocardiopsis potens]|uniref:hypothetical protein n=1 Tax=Nocardiopsis potens TaxID=1246458 RepID=UPI00034DDB0C|nr:hypothetical protein [Nocardiopsis potens]
MAALSSPTAADRSGSAEQHAGGPEDPLRAVLRVDGWSTLLFGIALLGTAPWLAGPLGMPASWLVPFGVAMLGGSAALLLIAGYPRIPPRLSAAVVAGNALSGAALAALVFSGILPLTGLGTVFLLSGAAVVAVYAGLEFTARRRSR